MGKSKVSLDNTIDIICEKDKRYSKIAYVFVSYSMDYILLREHKLRHLKAKEVLDGICYFAQKNFGLMASIVLEEWGIRTTDDIGNIIYNLVNYGVLSKSKEDSHEDFYEVFDLRERLNDYNIECSL